MKILVIDVGGTHVKALASGHKRPIEIPSGPDMTAKKMVAAVRQATAGWKYDAVSIGYPGPVLHGRPATNETANKIRKTTKKIHAISEPIFATGYTPRAPAMWVGPVSTPT